MATTVIEALVAGLQTRGATTDVLVQLEIAAAVPWRHRLEDLRRG